MKNMKSLALAAALVAAMLIPMRGAGATTGTQTDCLLDVPTGLVEVCVDVGDVSYLLHVLSGAGDIDGLYEAWCVDVPGGISVDCYDVRLVSSLDDLYNDVIAAPQNWDLINYLLNQVTYYRSVHGATAYDLQWVFWTLSNPGTAQPEIPDDQTLADLILDEVRTHGEGFVPLEGEFAAVAVVHADAGIQETIIPVRIVCTSCTDCDCGPCDGKVTKLTLRYDGPGTTSVTVTQKGGDAIFSGAVSSASTFSFVGTEKFGTMGTEITLTWGNGESVDIHTSCSQPIGPGLVFGDFTVISGESRNGGLLCEPGDGGERDESDESDKPDKSDKPHKSDKPRKSDKPHKGDKSKKRCDRP